MSKTPKFTIQGEHPFGVYKDYDYKNYTEEMFICECYTKEKAERIVKLLEEDEARKIFPRVDNQIKKEILWLLLERKEYHKENLSNDMMAEGLKIISKRKIDSFDIISSIIESLESVD